MNELQEEQQGTGGLISRLSNLLEINVLLCVGIGSGPFWSHILFKVIHQGIVIDVEGIEVREDLLDVIKEWIMAGYAQAHVFICQILILLIKKREK